MLPEFLYKLWGATFIKAPFDFAAFQTALWAIDYGKVTKAPSLGYEWIPFNPDEDEDHAGD